MFEAELSLTNINKLNREDSMKSPSGSFRPVGTQRVCVVLLTVITLASAAFAQTFSAGDKAKVKGTIMSRKGDLIKIQDDKTGSSGGGQDH